MRDSDQCWSHDASFGEARKRATSRAGRAGGRGRPGGEIGEIKEKLRRIADDLLNPEAKLKPANAAIAIQAYNAICNAIRTDLKQREQEDLVGKMEEIEDELTRQRGRGL